MRCIDRVERNSRSTAKAELWAGRAADRRSPQLPHAGARVLLSVWPGTGVAQLLRSFHGRQFLDIEDSKGCDEHQMLMLQWVSYDVATEFFWNVACALC